MAYELRILLIDDSPDDRALITRKLCSEFPGVWVEQIKGARGFVEALATNHFDLAIISSQPGWRDSLTILHTVKSRWPIIPVIMLAEAGSKEIVAEAMGVGLDGYVLKSRTYLGRLLATIRLILGKDPATPPDITGPNPTAVRWDGALPSPFTFRPSPHCQSSRLSQHRSKRFAGRVEPSRQGKKIDPPGSRIRSCWNARSIETGVPYDSQTTRWHQRQSRGDV